MKKAILTKDGARRRKRPELAGKTVEYDGIEGPHGCSGDVFYKGRRLGSTMSFGGTSPSLVKIED